MQAYNHLWQINKFIYKEVAQPYDFVDGFLYLMRNGVKYKMPERFVALYVPLNKYYIQMDKVSKYLERVN
jgi:hypothetical protein